MNKLYLADLHQQATFTPEGNLEISNALMRPTEFTYSAMDPRKIASELGWRSKLNLDAIVKQVHERVWATGSSP
jgi:GDP-D-mannose dehydratase